MIDRSWFQIGSYVHYAKRNYLYNDNGIIKGFSEDNRHAFIVYNCNDDWDNYKDYTGISTLIEDLLPGWRDKIKKK